MENVSYSRAGVGFAALHVVGSNNALAPWTGNGSATPEQQTEVDEHTMVTHALIDQTFAKAEKDKQRAVVLLTQADMFDVTVPDPQFADYSAFQPIVREIAAKAAAYGGPVYLFNGDSHVYNADTPLAPGSRWLSFYDVQIPAGNLNRITVDGSTEVNDYLRVTVNPQGSPVLSIVQVPFT